MEQNNHTNEKQTALGKLWADIRLIWGLFIRFRFRELLWAPTTNQTVQLFRYLIVAVLSTVVDFVGLYVGMAFGLHYLVANPVGYIFGILVTFLLSRYMVFSGNESRVGAGAEAVANYVIGFIAFGLTELLMWVFTDLAHINVYVSKFIATVIVFFWNFLARKKFLYKKTGRTVPAGEEDPAD